MAHPAGELAEDRELLPPHQVSLGFLKPEKGDVKLAGTRGDLLFKTLPGSSTCSAIASRTGSATQLVAPREAGPAAVVAAGDRVGGFGELTQRRGDPPAHQPRRDQPHGQTECRDPRHGIEEGAGRCDHARVGNATVKIQGVPGRGTAKARTSSVPGLGKVSSPRTWAGSSGGAGITELKSVQSDPSRLPNRSRASEPRIRATCSWILGAAIARRHCTRSTPGRPVTGATTGTTSRVSDSWRKPPKTTESACSSGAGIHSRRASRAIRSGYLPPASRMFPRASRSSLARTSESWGAVGMSAARARSRLVGLESARKPRGPADPPSPSPALEQPVEVA